MFSLSTSSSMTFPCLLWGFAGFRQSNNAPFPIGSCSKGKSSCSTGLIAESKKNQSKSSWFKYAFVQSRLERAQHILQHASGMVLMLKSRHEQDLIRKQKMEMMS
ncbi:hypothetical protein BDN72DRAFT_481557 [Pluteus cervinus]|uniref:Uncharacterized protein n=1 Tax=Pluteus cervinus TaxID=181527 RepID=A0ACD3B1N8_9AGAR|nr:hypothetical protein BDN72DRAFT_481557 [Pluteus cervinus]